MKNSIGNAMTLVAAIAIAGRAWAGDTPTEADVQNAEYQSLIHISTQMAKLTHSPGVSDAQKEMDAKMAREKHLKACVPGKTEGVYLCDISGEQFLWQMESYNGVWLYTGPVDRPK
jgi:hypothetical protein